MKTTLRIQLLLCVLIAFLSIDLVNAHHFLEKTTIHCTPEFPCPKDLTDRINFWVSIFGKHNSDVAILHDAKEPSRVYAVIEADKDACRHRRHRHQNPSVRAAKNKIENSLRSIADKLDEKTETWNEEERHFLEMFSEKSSGELKSAIHTIRCQTGIREYFFEGLQRFGRFSEMISSKLNKYNLSPDIVYLPFVESSYNPMAYSRVGAAGLWQIMPKTARSLGLTINRNVDERFDPDQATEAAAKYFTQSYKTLETAITSLGLPDPHQHLGPFVITSYNYGIVGAKNMIKSHGIDFADALSNYSGRRFKTAVQNFYASFLAAKHVAKTTDQYFGKYTVQSAPQTQTIAIQKNIPIHKLIKVFGIEEKQVRPINLALTSRVWSGKGYVPKGFNFQIPQSVNIADIRFEELWKEPLIEDRKESPPVDEVHYKVRRGDTPCGIAKKHHMNCQDLLALNQLDLRSIIVTGQLLALKEDVAKKPLVPEVEFIGPPPPPDLQEPQLKTLKASQTATTFGLGEDYLVNTSTIDNKKVYVMTIQSEETLGHYAEWLGLGSPSAIRELNNLNYQSYLSLGQTLVLPIRNDDQKKTFEERRIQYHKILEEEFRERYEVTGEEMYTVRRGDSESGIAKKFEIPAWLLRRFNPGVQSSTLKVKDLLRIPLLREKNNGS